MGLNNATTSLLGEIGIIRQSLGSIEHQVGIPLGLSRRFAGRLDWVYLLKGRYPSIRSPLKKAAGLVLALAMVATFLVATYGPVLADQPPGQKGYEGQPRIQGGGGSNGNSGYEGHTGKQIHN